ncbi:sensor histidine kinase [Nocardioides marmoriginsengisoli]|uniref:Oxygen sensor histidine kinase NreB n=1 Tax=Nocardioides marmoriginsengisoli TaxID=661483 RepID=A0A3N0CAY7_9ACTN|nr:sensor histidine kinase [Nocardioides marmoriginsengisoli]RNL60469.1 sensor histidine kinase [Nocardioides marmoriginsengisoli]
MDQTGQRWRLGPRGQVWFDRALVAAILVPVATFPFLLGTSWTVLGVLQAVPLLWRRTHPVAAFAAVAAASAVQPLFLDTPMWTQVAFPIATYSVARYAGTWSSLGALAVGFAGAVVATMVWINGYDGEVTPSTFAPYFVTIATIEVAAWALGTLGRTRQAYVDTLVERGERIAREAAQEVELAAQAERARIAREMHDVVAHGLSVIVVQADGARYAAQQQPELAVDTLERIAGTGREALDEMRRLLGLLRDGDTGTRPQPRLDDLALLIEDARGAGGDVRSSLPALGTEVAPGTALTAYRVVQEALSNVRKHAGPTATTLIDVQVLPGREVVVEVLDDGRGAAVADDGHGLGLVGMRERVLAHGGELETGPRPGGGYRVCARIPG